MSQFFYWSGALFWFLFGIAGMLWLLDQALEWIIRQFNFRKEFMAFVASRIKARLKP